MPALSGCGRELARHGREICSSKSVTMVRALTQRMCRIFPRHGLRGMRERAELIGAEFQIISQARQGTTVRLYLPSSLVEEPQNDE